MSIIKFNKDIIEALKELLTPDNFLMINSAYLGNRIGFKINNSWKDKYNGLIDLSLKYYLDNNLAYLLRIICICNPISKNFCDKYNVSSGYINLIRNSWFKYDEYHNALILEHKRPFGNSNILSDIKNNFNDSSILDEECVIILSEYNNILKNYLIHEEFEWFLEVNTNIKPMYLLTDNYFKTKNKIERQNKIKKLLE